VLWATNDSDVYAPVGEDPDYSGHRSRNSNDGPPNESTFDVDPLGSPAYDFDYGAKKVKIFGEWERLPVGGVYLQPGDYSAQIVLTEESFHGSGGEKLSGNWAAAMGAHIEFNITQGTLLIEAEDATVKTVGGLRNGGWCLWSNGTLAEEVYIPATATYEVVVRAYGSPLGGIWPEMALRVDGVAGETTTVDSGAYMDYSFQVELTSGVHLIGVSFLNDAYDPGVEDRNLYVDKFMIISPPEVDEPELLSR